jgi:hypothetical protein
MKSKILVLVSLLVFAWGCQKEEGFDMMLKNGHECGTKTFDLTAGQKNVIGDVEVWNEDGILYVTFISETPMVEFHLYVETTAPVSRLTPGHAPYKSGILNPAVTEFTFEVELGELDVCPSVLYLQAHAVTLGGETAYGGTIAKPKGSWFGNIAYTVQCCEEEEECTNETAFAGNTRGPGSSWFNYFDPAQGATQNIYAGNDQILIGTATYDGTTFTITLNANAELFGTDENLVKAFGFTDAPTERPNGKGNVYNGTDLTFPVAAFNFYVIHLDTKVCK